MKVEAPFCRSRAFVRVGARRAPETAIAIAMMPIGVCQRVARQHINARQSAKCWRGRRLGDGNGSGPARSPKMRA